MNAATAWTISAAALILACAAGIGGNAVGCLVLAIAALAPLSHRALRGDGRLALVFVTIVAAHAGIAVVNGLVEITPGADADALSFHIDAANFANAYAVAPEMTPSVSTYAAVLGFVYHVAGTSLLLGGALSVLAFAVAALVLLEIMRELDLRRRAATLALYGLLPSGVMFLSVPLREAFQQLVLHVAVLATLRMRTRGARWAVPMIVATALLGASHNGLELYAGFLILSGITWAARRGGRGRPQQLVGLAAAAAIVVVAVALMPNTRGTIEAVANGQAFEFADNYRTVGLRTEGRATYGVRLDASSPLAFAASLPVVVVEYMCAPFPWQVGNALDLDALAETVVRLALIAASLIAWRRATGPRRSELGLLIWLTLGMELLWALGTVNWGTAIRHHLPSLGLLALTGGPLLCDAIGSRLARLVPLRRAV